ncbi:MAG: DUF1841 family protein [Betaproteobacteria bacterium]|nr:MAG: DUF1841 family protein [Betaproteobacteria bacterium]
MYNPSRDQARQFFIDTWAKLGRNDVLTALEQKAAAIFVQHPEYHRVLERPESFITQDWRPESGDINPFLHFGFHLAIQEQLDIDQPPGIRAIHDQLAAKHDDEHAAKHEILECLGETLWQSQRTGQALDAALYLQLLRQRL